MHLLRRARIPTACLPAGFAAPPPPALEPWIECDLTVDGARISHVAPASAPAPARLHPSGASAPATDLGGVLVFPGLVDAHTHLDKCHTWNRAPNPRGEFWDALEILRADSAHWTAADLYRRADFGLRQAWAHGTVALRTHLDTGSPTTRESPAVIAQLRREWAGRITLQSVALCNLADFTAGQSREIIELAARAGASALGGFPQPGPDLPRQLDTLMAAARELGLGLDLHLDESNLAHAECLRATAEAVLRNAFPHPVACGHCCSLAVQPPERQRSTLALVRAARLRVIALPLCNLYLQDRGRAPTTPDAPRGARRTPFWRGLTLVHELLDAGVTVAAASDNVRDAFHAWGDFNALEVFRDTVRIGHLDTRLDVAPALVTTAAADIMGLPDTGRIAPGARADLVVTSARTFNELFARPAAPHRLWHQESFRPATPPDLAELD